MFKINEIKKEESQLSVVANYSLRAGSVSLTGMGIYAFNYHLLLVSVQ